MSKYFIFLLFSLWSSGALAQKIPPKPHQNRLYDYTNTLSAQQEGEIVLRLQKIFEQDSLEIIFVHIPSLKNYTLVQWVEQIRKTWKIPVRSLLLLSVQKENLAYLDAQGALGEAFCQKMGKYFAIKAFKEGKMFQASQQSISWLRAALVHKMEKDILADIDQESQSSPSWVFFAQLGMFLLMFAVMAWLLVGNFYKKKTWN